jgi:hypothetical protein
MEKVCVLAFLKGCSIPMALFWSFFYAGDHLAMVGGFFSLPGAR